MFMPAWLPWWEPLPWNRCPWVDVRTPPALCCLWAVQGGVVFSRAWVHFISVILALPFLSQKKKRKLSVSLPCVQPAAAAPHPQLSACSSPAGAAVGRRAPCGGPRRTLHPLHPMPGAVKPNRLHLDCCCSCFHAEEVAVKQGGVGKEALSTALVTPQSRKMKRLLLVWGGGRGFGKEL